MTNKKKLRETTLEAALKKIEALEAMNFLLDSQLRETTKMLEILADAEQDPEEQQDVETEHEGTTTTENRK